MRGGRGLSSHDSASPEAQEALSGLSGFRAALAEYPDSLLLSGYPTMMPSNPTAPSGRVPARKDIEGVIVSELATAQQKPVADIRTALVAAGPEMPLDSLETVEIMLSLEEAFGIRFPESPETCAAFQSVRALSDLVQQLAGEAGD